MTQVVTEDLSWVVFAEKEPDDRKCAYIYRSLPCAHQPVWSVHFGWNCSCSLRRQPSDFCDPHKDSVLKATITCQFCNGPVFIASVERL